MKTPDTTEKTYCVKGLLEWKMLLPTGIPAKPYCSVTFEGGQITGYGVAPATFSTSDPFLQKLIENSKWFKNNRIYVR